MISKIGANLKAFLKIDLRQSPVSFEIVSKADEDSYSRLLIRYNSNEGDVIPAYLLLPKKSNSAAVLIHHQHNGERHLGKSEVAGLAGNPLQAFGPSLAAKGFVVLTPDSICFEDRRPNAKGLDREEEGDFLQHFNEMTYRLIRGDTLMRKVLEDASVALSVLLGIEGVDPDLVGILGHSYGGNTTLFQAAIDDRVRYACASGALCSYKNKIERGTGLEFSLAIPGIHKQFDFADILTAAAQNPFLVVSADDDKYAKDADILVTECISRFGSDPKNLYHHRYQGGHALTQERFDKIIAWLVDRGSHD